MYSAFISGCIGFSGGTPHNLCFLCPKIKGAVDNIVFNKMQFALTDESIMIATRLVLDALHDISGTMSAEEKEEWCQQYHPIVSMHLNARRGYVQDRARQSIKEWRTQIEASTTRINNFPTPEDVLRCANRDLDLKLPEGAKPEELLTATKDGQLLDWYWNNLLAKCLGDKVWGSSTRHYEPISEAIHYHYRK